MSFEFFPHYALAREFEEIEEKLRRQGITRRERLVRDKARIAELEDDLGRVALLARSLAELCLAKGIITREELAASLLAVDMADGAGDRRLDPKVVLPGESKLADLKPVVPPTPPRRRR